MKDSLKRNIIACYISDVVLGTFFQLPIWIVYQSQFLSFEQIAFFAGLSLIVEVITQMPTGAFADIYGRRISLTIGNLFMALPMFLIAISPTPEIMWAYAIMWGLGNSFSMGTSKPLLYDTLKAEGKENLYPKIFSKSTVIFQISAAVSIASGGYLYQIMPSLPYYISGIASMFGVFTSFLFAEPKVNKANFIISEFIKTNKAGFVEIFKNKYVTKLTVLFVLMIGIGQASQQFFAQPYMLELGMNNLERSWVAMIIKVAIAIIGAKVIHIKKIYESKYFLLIIPILLVIALIPARFATLPLAYLIITGIAFASGNTKPFITPEINENLKSEVRSTALSAQNMISTLFRAFIQWISAYIIVKESIGSLYTYLGIFSLVVILPLAISVTHHKHKIVKNENIII